MNIRALPLALMVVAAPIAPALADDVTDQINEALTAYGRKDLPTAMAGLDAASNLIRQMRADVYGALLPEPPAGWTADKAETIAVGMAMAGGGTGATRKYHKGNDTVTISILTDSPLMQAMSMLTSTGLAGIGGMKTQIVNGRRSIFMKDDGAYMTVVGDRTLVRVEGKSQSEDTLKQFLTAVDFTAVEKAGK
jgi:hypothetical protein